MGRVSTGKRGIRVGLMQVREVLGKGLVQVRGIRGGLVQVRGVLEEGLVQVTRLVHGRRIVARWEEIVHRTDYFCANVTEKQR